MDNLLRIDNGELIERQRIPRVDFSHFLRLLTDFVHANGYVVQLFAYPEEGQTRLLAVVRNSNLFVLETTVDREFPSLTLAGGAKFSMFEREIAEQYGLMPLGHPWLKMVRYHPNYTGQPDVLASPSTRISGSRAKPSTRSGLGRCTPESSNRATFASSAPAKRFSILRFNWATSTGALSPS